MLIEIQNRAFVSETKTHIMDAIREALRIENPKYAENKRRGHSNWQTPVWIDGFEEAYGGLSIARGATGIAWHIAKQNGEPVEICNDPTYTYLQILISVNVQFTNQLVCGW